MLSVDATSGASRVNHTGLLAGTWNLLDKQGNLIPDGTYTMRLEFAEGNSTTAGQNGQGTFTFTKGSQAQNQTGLSNGAFTNGSISFVAQAQQSSATFQGLSVCPAGDVDLFKVQVTATGSSLEVSVFQSSASPLKLEILNAGGTAIVNGMMISAGTVRATALNLPVGDYYARVTSTAMNGQNNYELKVVRTRP